MRKSFLKTFIVLGVFFISFLTFSDFSFAQSTYPTIPSAENGYLSANTSTTQDTTLWGRLQNSARNVFTSPTSLNPLGAG